MLSSKKLETSNSTSQTFPWARNSVPALVPKDYKKVNHLESCITLLIEAGNKQVYSKECWPDNLNPILVNFYQFYNTPLSSMSTNRLQWLAHRFIDKVDYEPMFESFC